MESGAKENSENHTLWHDIRTVCHDISVELGWRACFHQSRQANSKEPADTDLQGVYFLDPALVNDTHVIFHMFDLAGSIRVDVMIFHPTVPSYVEHGLGVARLFSVSGGAKRSKHVLNRATMVPLVVNAFGLSLIHI